MTTNEQHEEEMRIIKEAIEIVKNEKAKVSAEMEAEKAKNAAEKRQSDLVTELSRLYKNPTFNKARIAELEKLLGWVEEPHSVPVLWHGSTNRNIWVK